MKIKTEFGQTGRLYFAVGIFSVVTSVLMQQAYALLQIPGCNPIGTACKNFDGRFHKYPKLTTSRINYCRNTTDKIELFCIKPDDKGCIASDCMPKSEVKGDKLCRSLFKDEEHSTKQHSVYAFQESCSSTHERIVCCQEDTIESILVAGYGAEAHEFPHQAMLLISKKKSPDSDGGSKPATCGGTIFNENYILTAAHCVVDEFDHPTYPQLKYSQVFDPDQIEVVVGTNIAITSPIGNRYRVEEVIIHDGYTSLLRNQDIEIANGRSPKTVKNDIALLKIKGGIMFNEYTKALKVAPPNFRPEEYADKVVIAGWGYTNGKKATEFLQKTNIQIRDSSNGSYCAARYGDDLDPAQHICLGGIVKGDYGKIGGGGDSGGPAVCRGADGRAVQCGITSFGIDYELCSNTRSAEDCPPSVYVDVSYFLPWILNKTGGQNTGHTDFFETYLYGINSEDDLAQVQIIGGDEKTCGGTLVSSNTVITASNCVFDKSGKSKKLLVKYKSDEYYVDSLQVLTPPKNEGNDDVNTNGINIVNQELFDLLSTTEVKGVKVEEPYYDANVAVLKLVKNVSGAKPVSLFTTKLTESEGIVHEAAWMRDSKFGLRKFPSGVISNRNCERRYDLFSNSRFSFPIGQFDVCLVEKYSGGNSCDRDIGGGVFCGGSNGRTLCGVQVFRMCDNSTPKIIADIYFYLNSISDLIQKNHV